MIIVGDFPTIIDTMNRGGVILGIEHRRWVQRWVGSRLHLGRGCQQIAHSHQVVGGRGKGEHPTDPRETAMAGLAQQRHGLEPPKASSMRLRLC